MKYCYICGKKITGEDSFGNTKKGSYHLECSEYEKSEIDKLDWEDIYELSGFELSQFLTDLKDKINEIIDIINEKNR